MATFPYKVEIKLSKTGNHRVSCVARHASGDILRGFALVESKSNLTEFVASHLKGMDSYDPTAMVRVHAEAVRQMESQSGK